MGLRFDKAGIYGQAYLQIAACLASQAASFLEDASFMHDFWRAGGGAGADFVFANFVEMGRAYAGW